MVKPTHEETVQPSSDRQSRCFNRECSQPQNPYDAATCLSCGSDLRLNNRYRAIQLIGQGGFGRTFKAVDESIPSHPYCAIKQFWLPSHSPGPDKALELFTQEAQRLEDLGENPSIPTLHDHIIESGSQYLVQDFVCGNNLSQELEAEGPWTEAKVQQLLLELLPLLHFVHHHQVIHRDIKPDNIIRRDLSCALVLVDFGAAKVVSETTLGKTGTVIGSAAYTAPEQVKGKAIFASDIYSLGVTCIHLLTQMPPFDLFDSGENAWTWRHYLAQPVSDRFAAILDKMLESGTNRRYGSAEAVLKDLQPQPVSPHRLKKLPQPKWTWKQWFVTGTSVVVGGGIAVSAVSVILLFGIRAAMSPIAQRVSSTPPSSSQSSAVERQPTPPEGGLYGYAEDGTVQTFPLQHTDVTANIAGNLSRVEVTQTFTNPYDHPLEAIYKFPLPDDAAVDDMEIHIGDRVIRGLIKKKEEAQEIYETAKREGKTAGLLEQQRDNIFTQSLANIRPGEEIEVVIRYTNSLQFLGNNYEFVFPMVVAPRYEAAARGQEEIGVAGAIASVEAESATGGDRFRLGRPAWASEVNPPYLSAETRSGHDINVTVAINAGVPIAGVESPSHPVNIQDSGGTTRIALTNQETIPNKDLILRYQVAGADTQATVLTQTNQQGGHFATYLIPAVDYQPDQIVPKDVVFLVDTSGSQSGEPIEQSKELMRQFISGLNEGDTFNIIDFSNRAQSLAERPLANTRANRSKALDYVSRLDANGGTELMNGVNTVLDFPTAPDGRLRSIVLLSDGLIGDDEHIIGQIRDRLQPGNRLYSFGVGSSTNRFLLNRLAELGRGTATIVPPDESAVEVAEKFFQEINQPIVTNIEVEWMGSGDAPEIYPQQTPDLFASQPLVLYGRKQDSTQGQLKITGTVAGRQAYEEVLDVDFQQVRGNGAIAQLWGRSRIKDLMNQTYGREEAKTVEAVTTTALDYRLLSKYTAFVAVTEEVRVDPRNPQRSEVVPVEIPEGMAQANGNSSASVPEPKEVIGNLLAVLLLLMFLNRKRLHRLALTLLPRKTSV